MIKANKSLGQNFLTDSEIIETIARSAAPEGSQILEIGPGLGAITDRLSERASKLIAVEIDERLIAPLRANFALKSNVEIQQADILKTDVNSLFDGEFFVVGNLPYYITTPIIMKLIEENVRAKAVTVMLQKEVADKISAPAGRPEYGVLAAIIQHFYEVEEIVFVPPESFDPMPKVDSQVIRLTPVKERATCSRESYIAVVKAAFSQRRKTLVNSLSGFRGLEKEDVSGMLGEMGLSEMIRAEKLSPRDFEILCTLIDSNKDSKKQ